MSTSGVPLLFRRYFCMIYYRKILELHDEGISLRGIAATALSKGSLSYLMIACSQMSLEHHQLACS